jgi:hypothetical protein
MSTDEREKTKVFADATLKILNAFDKMIEDNRISEEVREEYASMIRL